MSIVAPFLESPEIDRSRAGALHISLPFLAQMLGLPAGTEIGGARVDVDTLVIELIVEGAEMPPRDAEGRATSVKLVLTKICKCPGAKSLGMGKSGGAVETATYAHWEHAPERQWRLP
jgi:hypothetical protein